MVIGSSIILNSESLTPSNPNVRAPKRRAPRCRQGLAPLTTPPRSPTRPRLEIVGVLRFRGLLGLRVYDLGFGGFGFEALGFIA